MTLIQRQDQLVAHLQPIYAKHVALRGEAGGVPQHIIGISARARRLHREELIAAGYSPREAADSADQCNDIAWLNARCVEAA